MPGPRDDPSAGRRTTYASGSSLFLSQGAAYAQRSSGNSRLFRSPTWSKCGLNKGYTFLASSPTARSTSQQVPCLSAVLLVMASLTPPTLGVSPSTLIVLSHTVVTTHFPMDLQCLVRQLVTL